MTEAPFSEAQQEYLRALFATVVEARGTTAPTSESGDLQRTAQDRVLAAGGRLTPEEEAKRRKHPLDRMAEIEALAAAGRFPRGTDIFLGKFHGLFYVAPAQDSFMCRLRIPGGQLSAHQMRGIAAVAEELGGCYADITTRANLQLREIGAAAAPEVLRRVSELGLTSRGSGADNVRNITASPTAGIDAQELIDTRPLARALHHHILNRRELYGLPRKFNIGFDGGGRVPVLEDGNDVALTAVRVGGDVLFHLGLGGITGHGDLARPTGVLVRPEATTQLCDAILRVFIAHGDRTDRNKARLKYVLDAWSLEAFLAEVERLLGASPMRVDPACLPPRLPEDRLGHIGVHPQKQPGRCYIGVVCPVGRLSSARLRGLAEVAERFGSGTLRLTVWQNLLISDIAAADVDSARAAIAALGLATEAAPLRAGLVACTGSAGCRFAASDTKAHATWLVDWLEARIALRRPLNIHLTGCPHSCAQHRIADIGLLAVRLEQGEDVIDGYDVHVGGGAGATAGIGRRIRGGVPLDVLAPMLLALLTAWQQSGTPTFREWSAAQPEAALSALCEAA